MSEVTLNAEQLKTLLKAAIVEILQEQKGSLYRSDY
jgi:hypothetical protein